MQQQADQQTTTSEEKLVRFKPTMDGLTELVNQFAVIWKILTQLSIDTSTHRGEAKYFKSTVEELAARAVTMPITAKEFGMLIAVGVKIQNNLVRMLYEFTEEALAAFVKDASKIKELSPDVIWNDRGAKIETALAALTEARNTTERGPKVWLSMRNTLLDARENIAPVLAAAYRVHKEEADKLAREVQVRANQNGAKRIQKQLAELAF
jgi:hypothetical protein